MKGKTFEEYDTEKALKNGSIVIDVANDILTTENYLQFIEISSKNEGTILDTKFAGLLSEEESGTETFTIDYGSYGIDLMAIEDAVYFPLTSYRF